jgi:Ni,Fe-hydrogenase III large subunit/Ni,Fe-hydrogenase III component G
MNDARTPSSRPSGPIDPASEDSGFVRHEVAPDEVRVVRVHPAEVEGLVHAMAQREQARVADLFGSIEDGTLVLRLVYGLEPGGGYLVIEWPVGDSEYPPLSDIAPAAFVEECEVDEQFGVRPSSGRPLNRLLIPPHSGERLPRLGSPPKREPRQVHAPHFVSGEAFEFPFGPVRAVAQESLYYGIVTSGEEVLDLYLLQWHKHRGIERRLRGLNAERGLFLVERAEGLSAVGNGWAFCRAVETIGSISVSDELQCARAVALELERLYNHAAAIAALAQSTGLSVGQAQAEIALEKFLRLNLATFGHRYLFGVLAIGGVTRSLDAGAVGSLLPDAASEFRRVVSSLIKTNSFMDRLEACGIVTPEAARRLGLVGPVARGSGQDLDTRRDHAFGAYRATGALDDRPVEIAVRGAGDVLSRMDVMVAEVEESVRLVSDLQSHAARAQPVDSSAMRRGATGRALGWSESPRGESLIWLDINVEGRIERARLRPASVRNWRAFDDAARSRNVFTDLPIIEASFWLTVAGLAR